MSVKILAWFFSSDSSITVTVGVSLTYANISQEWCQKSLVAQWYFHLGGVSHAG